MVGREAWQCGSMPNDAKALIETARKQLQTLANFNLDQTLRQWEKAYVEAALNMTHGNLSQAAKILGINRTTLYKKMKRLGLMDVPRSGRGEPH